MILQRRIAFEQENKKLQVIVAMWNECRVQFNFFKWKELAFTCVCNVIECRDCEECLFGVMVLRLVWENHFQVTKQKVAILRNKWNRPASIFSWPRFFVGFLFVVRPCHFVDTFHVGGSRNFILVSS